MPTPSATRDEKERVVPLPQNLARQLLYVIQLGKAEHDETA